MTMQVPVSEDCKCVRESFSGAEGDYFICYGSEWIYQMLKFHTQKSQASMVRKFGKRKIIEGPCLKKY